ncbi:hypothetical protein V6N13_044415 [Hibiscus sabdariffa]
MGDYESPVPHLVGALGSNKILAKDVKKILAELGSQLTSMAAMKDDMVEGWKMGIRDQLSVVEEKITSWEANESVIWDSGPDEAVQYLNAVDQAHKLAQRLENQSSNSQEDKDLLRRAYDVLHMAMQRLGEEFKHMLVHHRQPFEPEKMSPGSNEGSIASLGDHSIHIDLVNPESIRDLKCIASLMFNSDYGLECC